MLSSELFESGVFVIMGVAPAKSVAWCTGWPIERADDVDDGKAGTNPQERIEEYVLVVVVVEDSMAMAMAANRRHQ